MGKCQLLCQRPQSQDEQWGMMDAGLAFSPPGNVFYSMDEVV